MITAINYVIKEKGERKTRETFGLSLIEEKLLALFGYMDQYMDYVPRNMSYAHKIYLNYVVTLLYYRRSSIMTTRERDNLNLDASALSDLNDFSSGTSSGSVLVHLKSGWRTRVLLRIQTS